VASEKSLAVAGFAQGDSYDAARPRYPEEAIEHFVATFHLDERSHVLDLGAGTGIFARQLLPFVGRLTAVDPSASMRATFARHTPGVTILEGSDVDIPVADGDVAAVFAAQAFHWFDAAPALVEMRRVLATGGGLGLIWNERDADVPWIRELNHAMLWDVHQPYDPHIDFAAIVRRGPFRDVEVAQFRHETVLTHDQIRARVVTTSYITLMNDADRDALVSDVTAVLASLPDPVAMPYVTNVFTAFAREPH